MERRTWTTAMACVLGACGMLAAQEAGRPESPLPALTNTTVSIPWPELKALLEKARPDVAERPPVPHVFAPASYDCKVGEKAVEVTASCEVSVLDEGWTLVPLGGAPEGLLKVTLDGAPCPVAMLDKQLFAPLSGKGRKFLAMVLERPVQAAEGWQRFDCPLLPAAIVTVSVTIPQTDLEVDLTGSTARVEEKGGATAIAAAVRGGQALKVSWRKRLREAALIYADTETLVSVEDGLIRCTSTTELEIVHAPVAGVSFQVDPQAVVLSAQGPDVLRWTDEVKAGAKAVRVTFSSPVSGKRKLTFVCERDVPEAGGEMKIPVPAVVGAKRDRGAAAVRAVGGFEVKPGSGGPQRAGVSELPASLRQAAGSEVQFGYRYVKTPAELALVLEPPKRLPPKLYAATHTLVTVAPGLMRCRANVHYDILHAPVDGFRLALPDDVDLIRADGQAIRETNVVQEQKDRVLVVSLKDIAKGSYDLTVAYEQRIRDDQKELTVPLVGSPEAVSDRGRVGVEVWGGMEIQPTVTGASRIDVKDLPADLWGQAVSPLLLGFQYDKRGAKIALAITKHKDVDVLVAMSDICETSTTITPDGKTITKMMFILRNNLKQFLVLKMPAGSQVWSVFVDDSPVRPSINAAGELLIPLKQSEEVDEDEDDSYQAKREQRRSEPLDRARGYRAQQMKALRERASSEAPADLKPYDVEVVFVQEGAKPGDRGELKVSLPAGDVPVGHLAWAIFLPKELRVLDVEGNCKEVSGFSLPFRHFGEAEYIRQQELAKAADRAMALHAAAEAMQAQLAQIAAQAKASGVLPVRVEIPITGEINRFEKFLVVNEAATVKLVYRRKID